MLRVPVVVVDDLPLLLLLPGREARLLARLGCRVQHALAKLTPGHVGQAQLVVFIELLLQAVDELVRDGVRLALGGVQGAPAAHDRTPRGNLLGGELQVSVGGQLEDGGWRA